MTIDPNCPSNPTPVKFRLEESQLKEGAIAPSSTPDNRSAYDQDLATFCKALSHPARVKILAILLVRQSCICGEIVDVLPLAQSTVSEHLRILKQANLIQGEVEGNRICYCVNTAALEQFKTLVATL